MVIFVVFTCSLFHAVCVFFFVIFPICVIEGLAMMHIMSNRIERTFALKILEQLANETKKNATVLFLDE